MEYLILSYIIMNKYQPFPEAVEFLSHYAWQLCKDVLSEWN